MDTTQLIQKQEMLVNKINEAQFVLVGVGEEFNEKFSDIDKYPQLKDALDKVDEDEECGWVVPYLEKLYITSHKDGRIEKAYDNLYELVKDKDYFIVTTCIDGNIKKAGFDSKKIVAPCGSYSRLQCSIPCDDELYRAQEYMDEISRAVTTGDYDMLPSMQPKCPKCGAPLVFNNVMCGAAYVEAGYQPQWDEYTKWLKLTLNKKICVLELGAGLNMPNIIRWAFEKIAFYNKKADFFRINKSLYQMTEDLGDKGISIAMDSVEFLQGCRLSDRK